MFANQIVNVSPSGSDVLESALSPNESESLVTCQHTIIVLKSFRSRSTASQFFQVLFPHASVLFRFAGHTQASTSMLTLLRQFFQVLFPRASVIFRFAGRQKMWHFFSFWWLRVWLNLNVTQTCHWNLFKHHSSIIEPSIFCEGLLWGRKHQIRMSKYVQLYMSWEGWIGWRCQLQSAGARTRPSHDSTCSQSAASTTKLNICA